MLEYTGRSVPFSADTPLTGPALLDASNLVAVTASVGQTLDALRALMSLAAEVSEIDRTRALLREEEDADMDDPLPSSDGMEEELTADQDDDVGVEELTADQDEDVGVEEGPPGVVAGGGGGDRVGSEVEVVARGAELPGGRQAMLASRARFEVTSRDRLYLQMANLPRRFHQMVAGEFGGLTLLELTAANLATRLLDSNTPASVCIYVCVFVCVCVCASLLLISAL